MPANRKDFSYSNLISVAEGISQALFKLPDKNPLFVVISTVLPGTMRTNIMPVLKNAREDFRFAYNPFFIAMGTTVSDFLNPEFILIGAEDHRDALYLEKFCLL